MKQPIPAAILFILIAIALFCSTASAYTVFGGAFYCTGCADCVNALNNNTLKTVYLNASIASSAFTCINSPAGFDNKIFDCQGNIINYTGVWSGEAIIANQRNNITIRNCRITNYNTGIYFLNSTNNTIINNTLISNKNTGLLFYLVTYSNVINNSIFNQNAAGYNNDAFVFQQNSTHNNIIGNKAYNNSGYGFKFTSNFWHNLVINNTAINNNKTGFYLYSGFNNTFINNTLYNNTEFSFYIWADLPMHCQNTLMNNTGGYFNKPIRYDHDVSGLTLQNTPNTYAAIIWCGVNNSVIKNVTITNAPGKMDGLAAAHSLNNNFTNILSHDNQLGLALYLGANNQVTNVTVYNTGNTGAWIDYGGIFLYGSTGNTIKNSKSYNNTLSGIYVSAASHNTNIVNNTAYRQTIGFYIQNSNNCNLTNNTAYNTTTGFALDTSLGNRLINNTVYDASYYGFYIKDSANSLFENNTIHSNSEGFSATPASSNSSTLTIKNNEIYNNSIYGIQLTNAHQSTLQDNHIYNNTIDTFLQSTSGTMIVTMINEIFDNSLGNYANYTNLSLTDTIGTGNSYAILWFSLFTPLPTSATSFQNTSLVITFIAGSPVLDIVRWHWTDTQLNASGINESKLKILRSDGTTWRLANNQALNTTANHITVTNLNAQGIFSILNYTAPVPPPRKIGGGGGGASRNSIYNLPTTPETTPNPTETTSQPLIRDNDAILEVKEKIPEEKTMPEKKEPSSQIKMSPKILTQKYNASSWQVILGIILLLILLLVIAVYIYTRKK